MPLTRGASRLGPGVSTTLPASLAWYGGAAWDGGSRVVATAFGGTAVAYSSDYGATWSGASVGAANYYGVGYIPSVFVGVINGSRNVIYSSDGSSWSTATNAFPTARSWQRIVGGGGTLVAPVYNSNYVAWSTNGTAWSERTGLPSTSGWSDIAFGDGTFVVIAGNVAGARTDRAAYSTDGTAFSASSLPSVRLWSQIAFGNGVFVVGGESNFAAYSVDGGVTWSSAAMPGSALDSWAPVYAGNGVFIASDQGNPSTNGAISYDLGKSWASWTYPASAWWETASTNAGDRAVHLGRSSTSGMYVATTKRGPTVIVQSVNRAATF